jgi:hypothetical protein
VKETLQYPWDAPPPAATPPNADVIFPKAKPRGRRPASARRVAALASTTAADWLYHHLTISGPAKMVEKFAAAARGSGVIPWQLDFAAIEEDVFVRVVSQPARDRKLTVEGCRILARQFRERVEAHHARAVAMVGRSFACPFDLHRLLPVPAAILQLGPTDPVALAWLAARWGTTDRLRQVTVRPKPHTGRRLPQADAVIGYGFFSFGDTPLAAISRLATDWLDLHFRLVPRPSD